jgi:hypothetical protein
MANRPDFVQNAEYRRQCLGELAYLRELRHESKQRLLALASHTSRSDGGGAASVNAGPLFPPRLGKINTWIYLWFQKPKSNDFLMSCHTYVSSCCHSPFRALYDLFPTLYTVVHCM